jgi:NDP-sugar pyrophosphorylase family protein
MIFAAGMGTRLQPMTLRKPKALVLLRNKPLLQHAIEYMSGFGFDDIIINVHHFGDQIIEFIQTTSLPARVTISDERSQLLDTGGGLKKAAWFFDDDAPFLIYNTDVLTDSNLTEMLHHHQNSNSDVTLAVRANPSGRYLLFDKNMLLVGRGDKRKEEQTFINQYRQDAKPFGFNGIHVMSPKVFGELPDAAVFPILPWYLQLSLNHKITGFDQTGHTWMDLGKPQNLLAAESLFDKILPR